MPSQVAIRTDVSGLVEQVQTNKEDINELKDQVGEIIALKKKVSDLETLVEDLKLSESGVKPSSPTLPAIAKPAHSRGSFNCSYRTPS